MTVRQPRLRVLVVENEMLLRLVAEEMVLKLGHEIVGSATSAQGAITEAERTRPHIVLMDIQLDGDGDGIDAALASLRAALDRLPGVAVPSALPWEPIHPQPPLVIGGADELSPASGDATLQMPGDPSKPSQ